MEYDKAFFKSLRKRGIPVIMVSSDLLVSDTKDALKLSEIASGFRELLDSDKVYIVLLYPRATTSPETLEQISRITRSGLKNRMSVIFSDVLELVNLMETMKVNTIITEDPVVLDATRYVWNKELYTSRKAFYRQSKDTLIGHYDAETAVYFVDDPIGPDIFPTLLMEIHHEHETELP